MNRVVRRNVSALFFVPKHEREFDNPEEVELLGVDFDFSAGLQKLAAVEADASENGARLFPLRRREEHDVAVLNVELFFERLLFVFREEFENGAFPRAVFRLDERKTLCAERLCHVFEALQFALRDVGKTLCVNRLYYVAVLDDVCEHLELAVLENVGEVLQFDSEARVGLVHAVAVHGVAVLHAGEGRGNVHSEGVLPDFFEHVFDKRVHVFAVDEAKLDIDLRKFGLAVCAEVFVAEAFSHLVVAFDARYHQHLLVLLGRLVERVEHAGVCAAGHEEFARAFGRALEKNGGFDFDEILRVEVVADSLCRLVAHAQKVEVARSAEVEIAVLEAEVFVDPVGVFVVEGKGSTSQMLCITMSDATTSISPVLRFGFLVPSSLSRLCRKSGLRFRL